MYHTVKHKKNYSSAPGQAKAVIYCSKTKHMHQITPMFQNLSHIQASAKLTVHLHTISKQKVEAFIFYIVRYNPSVSFSPPNMPLVVTRGIFILAHSPT